MEPRFFSHDAAGVTLNVAAFGDPAKPLLVALHGFPEYWTAWRAVAERLCDDFHVVLPDQRGYGASSRPEGVTNYRAGRLAEDVASLADRLSPDRPFVLAGHDWGASVAYAHAFAHPERLSHLIIANGVHPVCFQRALLDDPAQREASQYIPWLCADGAEAVLAADGYRRLMTMIEGFSAAPFLTEETRRGYVEVWSQPGALTAMLNWYRASPIVVPEPGGTTESTPILDMPSDLFRVPMPHLVLWGERDRALRQSCLDGLSAFAPDLTIRRFADASHWVLHENPEEVAAAIRSFVGPETGSV